MFFSSSVSGCEEVYKGKRIFKSYPIIGMNINKLSSFLGATKDYLKGKNILSITFNDPNTAIIKTGFKFNPVSGNCIFYYFKKVKGVWELDSESKVTS